MEPNKAQTSMSSRLVSVELIQKYYTVCVSQVIPPDLHKQYTRLSRSLLHSSFWPGTHEKVWRCAVVINFGGARAVGDVS